MKLLRWYKFCIFSRYFKNIHYLIKFIIHVEKNFKQRILPFQFKSLNFHSSFSKIQLSIVNTLNIIIENYNISLRIKFSEIHLVWSIVLEHFSFLLFHTNAYFTRRLCFIALISWLKSFFSPFFFFFLSHFCRHFFPRVEYERALITRYISIMFNVIHGTKRKLI